MKKTTRIATLSAAAVLIFVGLFFSCSDSESDGTPNPDTVVKDADITGVWEGTMGTTSLCVYAENDILYIAAENNGRYVYSKTAVWGTYTVCGNTVAMDAGWEEYTGTVKDNTLIINAGELPGTTITLTKVESAIVMCADIEN